MAPKKTLILPHLLIEAVKDQRAVVVFGAGASKECVASDGRRPLDANGLRDHLAQKFLGTSNETRDLATVAEMAISSGAGEPLVFDELERLFRPFEPSDAHKLISSFRWRGLATTNYDTLIEQAFSSSKSRKQVCVPFVKDSEPYEDRLKSEPDSVALLKLHGCLGHRLDPDIPLVLSHEHYHRLRANRENILNRLRLWAQHSVLIFVGYRLADSHIRALVYEIDPGRRPQWYIVALGADEHDETFWLSKNIQVIDAKFGQFVSALDRHVPELFRSLTVPESDAGAPYVRHFRTREAGSDSLRRSLEVDLQYVHNGIEFEEVAPARFYSGFDDGWCCIIRKYDFSRKAGEKLLYAAADDETEVAQKFFLLVGPAGAGKTIALKRAAYDASDALDHMVFWLRRNGRLRAEFFQELYGLTGKRAMLFVDHVSLHAEELASLLSKLRELHIPICVVASEREAEWHTYCSDLERSFPPELVHLGGLSEREAEDLVDLLERHNCLGMLAERPRAERIGAFMDKDRSDRQLLVALHELTQGKPFEEIILEEFQRILPNAAQSLYLDIATMHQFGVMARAGAVSRISGIRFEDFEQRFFQPLKNIVRVTKDRFTGDNGYATRHVRVAQIVFSIVCRNDESRSTQLSRIISGLDAGYSSDKRILEGVCRGRKLAEQFSDVSYGREIFDSAMEAAPRSAFLFQQAAIYEYTHRSGSLDRAQELADQSRSIDDYNHIYIHTQAEVARRKANQSATRVAKDKLRAQSRRYLNQIWFKDSIKALTFCNLLVDEATDLLERISESAKDHEIIEFDEKVDEAVERLTRAQREYPNEAEFASVEARLWQKLGESGLAVQALERAIDARPKNSSAYGRLAKIRKSAGEVEPCIGTLKKGLERFPDDKSLHLQLALELIEGFETPSAQIDYHLKSSFTAGDNNLDARFYFAEYLFWAGKIDECFRMFQEIDKRALESYRKSAPIKDDVITRKLVWYSGAVDTRKERFFFIRFGGFPSPIFAHMSSIGNVNYEDLGAGDSVDFRLRFNRKGPVAVRVEAR